MHVLGFGDNWVFTTHCSSRKELKKKSLSPPTYLWPFWGLFSGRI
jgi:hypothetical protein